MGRTISMLFISVLYGYYLMPSTHAEHYSIVNYNSGAGLHYENIGEANIYLKDFNMVTFYDLRKYLDNCADIKRHVEQVQQFCITHRSLSADCGNFLYAFNETTKVIEHKHELISDILGITVSTRQKRFFGALLLAIAPIAVMGIFGLAQSSIEQRRMSAEIEKYREEVSHLREMVSHQMYLYQNLQSEVNSRFATVSNQIRDIVDNVNKLAARISNQELRTQLLSLVQYTNSLIQIFSTEQSDLLDCLILARQGVLHPIIISPTMLKKKLLEVRQIVGHDTDVGKALEAAAHNANTMFNMLKPVIYVENQTIVFDLKVPLIIESLYDIYKLTSVPVLISDDVYAYIYPEHPYLFVDKKNERHFFLDKYEFDKCRSITENKYVCKRSKPLRIRKLTCEHMLISDDEVMPENCDIRTIRIDRTLFVELESDGSWIFVAPNPEILHLYCDQQLARNTISGSGMISVNSTCGHTETAEIILRDYSTNNLNVSRKYEVYRPSGNLRKYLEDIDVTHCPSTMNLMVLPRGETVKMKEIGTPLPAIFMENQLRQAMKGSVHYTVAHSIVLYTVCIVCLLLLCVTIYMYVSMKKNEQLALRSNMGITGMNLGLDKK